MKVGKYIMQKSLLGMVKIQDRFRPKIIKEVETKRESLLDP